MTYIPIYSLNGEEPAPLPPGISADDAASSGYIIVAPKPGVAEGEEAHWNGQYWIARPIQQETTE